jgi:hypothetical protein
VASSNAPVKSHADRVRQLAARRQEIMAMPPDEALSAIIDHPQPAALVHAFPEEDFHFLIYDIGLDDALPLIRLASNRQWEYLLDMETWNRDQMNYPAATTWLNLMHQADPERLAGWCFDDKLEFLELYLFRNIEVRVREPEQAPSDLGEGFFSDDDTFYLRFVDYPVATPEEEIVKKRRNELLSRLLKRLSRFDHPRYQGLLLESVSLIPSEVEEELYRLRNVRLAEKGFLPFQEAIGVYQPLRPGDVAARSPKIIHSPSPDDMLLPVPQMAAAFLEADDLFVRALKHISEAHVLQQLQVELAALCNRVVSADKEMIRSRDQLKKVVHKVSGYLSIGIERLTQKAEDQRERLAATLIQQHLLADIFRAGFDSVLRLKWKADRWQRASWCHSQEMALTFWDETWMGLLGGLLIDRPKYYTPSADGSSYRDFKTLAEIEATARGLDQVMALDRLFEQMTIPAAKISGISFLTYKNLLLTLWTRSLIVMPGVDAGVSAISIPYPTFKPFFAALWTTQGGRRFIGDEKKTSFLKWVAKASNQTSDELSEQLGPVFEALFNEIEAEFASVDPETLDPRYIHLFLIQP